VTSVAASTRDALLDAAEDLFSRRGYADVGTREIADLAGVNLASIAYHFGGKRELYLETVRRVTSRPDLAGKGGPQPEAESPWTIIDCPPRDAPHAEEMLRRFVTAYVRHIRDENRPQSCGRLMLWEAIRPSSALDDVMRDYIRPGHERLVAVVAALLPPGSDLDPRLCARSVLGQILHESVFRTFIERLEQDDPIGADAAAAHIIDFSLRAMGPCAASPAATTATGASS
jgi:AcrR family transcriptional regulator